ncbi:MAG: hypothetical protein JWL82_335 [Parcubacteria group bacterium]|nr:hypothetical protein [Parcubacteria group bacterium]
MPPLYQVPTHRTPIPHRNLLIAGAVIVTLALLVLGYLLYLRTFHPGTYLFDKVRFGAVTNQIVAPQELKKAVYVNNGRLYSDTFVTVKMQDWHLATTTSVIDYARTEHSGVILAFDKTTKEYKVATVDKQLLASAKVKRSLALSPDGTKVAYAEANGNPGLPGTWTVVVMDIATGKELYRAPGFTVFFLSDATVIRFTQKGIERTNIADASSTLLTKSFLLSPVTRAAQSPDRSFLAWTDPQDGMTKVYKIGDEGAVLQGNASQDIPAGGSLAVSPQSLYWLNVTPKASVLWRYPLTGGSAQKIREANSFATKLVF